MQKAAKERPGDADIRPPGRSRAGRPLSGRRRTGAAKRGKVSAGVPGEYVQRRIGAVVPEPNIKLRSDAGMDLVSSCGVPAALIRSDADGTASRAATARYLDFSVQQVADAMAAEFSRKLGTPVTLGFEHLWRADTVLTMARAAAQLTASGVSIKDALDAVGLGED